jgi:uncharacterized ion transporter superfamily protein YfcC
LVTLRLPHPFAFLLSAVLVAAALTWVLPAGLYNRRDDPATGRVVAIAGTYHRVPAAPVGPSRRSPAIPRGFIAAADVIAVTLLVGGAFVVVDRIGTLSRLVAVIASAFRHRPVGGRMFAVAACLWTAWTIGYASRTRTTVVASGAEAAVRLTLREIAILAAVIAPMGAYVYGALRLDWGFNELGGLLFFGGILAGLLGGLRPGGTVTAFLEGAQSLLPATMLIGLARSLSLVLTDGQIIDTILHGLATPLAFVSAGASALLMIPFQSIVHVLVPSVSGQAVLTMPILVPLADLLSLSRQVPVLAYQTGAGLMELLTPTNGALMSVLLAANVRYEHWLRFAVGGWALGTLIGAAAIAAVLWLGIG